MHVAVSVHVVAGLLAIVEPRAVGRFEPGQKILCRVQDECTGIVSSTPPVSMKNVHLPVNKSFFVYSQSTIELISGFQALRQARVPVAGPNPCQKVSANIRAGSLSAVPPKLRPKIKRSL
ncbi:hypothetical protein PoB_003151100 [Plakobranchus ocellatus]|uniref:Uncharacterized protein n=1 Tax=Plakobranchus ocellatus TaxID=259542 RepID=A0AAV4A1A6_9GAST|nr:hypothetical protein PoB_003151100 [Plakobranchus ocellatus]